MKFRQKISEEIFQRKYMINGETDPDQVFEDVSTEISSVESKENKEKFKSIFKEELSSGRFVPGGRILANARTYTKMKNYNNCFTIKVEDSMDGIYSALKEDAIISSMGGGVGFDVSNLRPENAEIARGGESSGPISFLKVFDQSAKVIHTGGGRRCLPATYSIQLFDKSWKKITEITVGDRILFENNSYRVNEFFENGEQDLIKITSENGYHVSTPNHRWLVLNLETNTQEWVEAKDLFLDKIKFAFLRPKNQ